MRLLRCHIEHFGKFSDYTVDFEENPCVFNEPNGWGKSTLASFIKVMFYGFANEKKRGDALERERVRFRPWQGGVYGGELVFEAGGKKYLLNRTFGKKEAEDTFALYDAATNLLSEDYTANIGEELFQINQESFLRTVFIAQNDCDTGATDSINAKIGNLTDCLDDMNNYESVQEKIKNLRNNLTPSRKTGALRQQKEELAQLRDELRRVEAAGQAVEELEAHLAGCVEERGAVLTERSRLQEKWEALTAQRAVEAKRTHYTSILNQWEEKRGAVDRELAELGGSAPDRETLQTMQNRRNELLRAESEAAVNELSRSEQENYARLCERFAKGVPDEKDIRRGQGLLLKLEELRSASMQNSPSGEERQEYAKLQDRFAGANVEGELDEAIRQWNLYIDKKNGLGTKQATLTSLKALEQSARSPKQSGGGAKAAVFMAVLAFCLLAAGGVLTAMQYAAVGVALLAVGAVAMAAAVVWIGVSRTRKNAEQLYRESTGATLLEREIADDEALMAEARQYAAEISHRFGMGFSEWDEDERRVRDELYALRNDWNRMRRLQAREQDYLSKGYEEQIQELREQVLEILTPFCAETELAGGQSGLLGAVYAALEKDRADYETLKAKSARYADATKTAADLRDELWKFLKNFGQGEVEDLDTGLRQIVRVLNDYENDRRDLDRLKREREAFETSYDIRCFEGQPEEATESEEALKQKMEQAEERAAALLESIHSYQTQLEARQQELDELQLQRERLEELEQEYERNQIFYEHLGLTAEYLEKAKESLSARYIGPVYDSFQQYYALLSGETAEAFRMDANLHVTRRDMGEQREVREFSLGNQDLINIVLRVALVDAMYEKEKPFLVLDDSFVNLDGERLKTAGTFLHKIAEDYQVIYFTCHESRAL